MTMTKIRGFIGAVVALILGICLISIALGAFGIFPPVLGAIPRAIGIGG